MTTSTTEPQELGMDRHQLGLRLRELREAAGVTQSQLAKALGEFPANVSRWETGRMEIPSAHVPEICAVLGCTLDDFFRPPTVTLEARKRGRPKKPRDPES